MSCFQIEMRKVRVKLLFIIVVVVVIIFLCGKKRHHRISHEAFPPSYIIISEGNGIKTLSAVHYLQHDQTKVFINETIDISETGKFLIRPEWLDRREKVRRNKLHAYSWFEICGARNLDGLLYHPTFPHGPSQKTFVKDLDIQNIDINTGMFIFGFVIPDKSGDYTIKISCHNIVGNIWFSESEDPLSVYLLEACQVDDGRIIIKQSNSLNLIRKKKYFISIVIKTSVNIGSFKATFSSLNEKTRKMSFCSLLDTDTFYQQAMSGEQPMLKKNIDLNDLYNSQENKKRSQIYRIPFMKEEDARSLFPVCEYLPSYIVERKLGKYHGVWETHYSSIYPADETDMPLYYDGVKKPHMIFGNPSLPVEVTEWLVGKVVLAIDKFHTGKYQMNRILSVEENKDLVKGDRYLVELELIEVHTKQNVRFSEYVYRPKGSENLCFPKGFAWNKTADVNYILTSAGQSRWVVHFIQTMARIYTETKDPNMNVIIVDFNTTDVDLVKILKNSGLKRFTLLKRSGKFHKTLAIQHATATIFNPHAIALQVDLHLTIPYHFTDSVRKHTVLGKMVYSPLLNRLQCGSSPQTPSGFWEIDGYGIISMYKKDWDRIGGMSVCEYKDKWGGEDWDLLDSVLTHRYEIERQKIKNFHHVFHSKHNMWNNFQTR